MMKLILEFHQQANDALKKGTDIKNILNLPVREKIGRYKYTPNEDIEKVYLETEREIAMELSNAGGAVNG